LRIFETPQMTTFSVVPLPRRTSTSWVAIRLFAVGMFVLAGGSTALSQNFGGVLTQHNDNARTGQNLNESVLTRQNVSSATFGKIFSYSVDGQLYTQPLYVPNVSVPGQGTHNVVYVATENDSVYAFDAEGLNSVPLWHDSFIDPQNGITPVSCAAGGNNDISCNVYPVYGITGTPVIDPSSSTMYLVARTAENGTYFQRLHALDITTGAEKFGGPVVISATVPGNGEGSVNGMILFDPLRDIQRTGLLLVNGIVYIGWAGSAHGWIMGYNAQTLAQVAVFSTTPNAKLGGVWQSGNGLAADDLGNIYVAVGDALFDANSGGVDYGDSLLKMDGNLKVLDYFTPKDETCRQGIDLDLGSGGPVLLTSLGSGGDEVIIAGKGGAPCEGSAPVYVLNQKHLGGYHPLKDQIVETVKGSPSGYWSSPAYWQTPNATSFYLAGTSNNGNSGDYLDMYAVSNGRLSSAPVAQSTNIFPVGATPSVSANKRSEGIVWAIARQDLLTSKPGQLPAILYAYDATNISVMLYNSSQVVERDQGGCANKFQVPTIANGKVYVGTQNELDVFGLLGKSSRAPGVFFSNPCYTFPVEVVGKTSLPKSVTLTNSGTAALEIQSITMTGMNAPDFDQTDNCGHRLAAGASCKLAITFSPSVAAPRTAFVTIADNAVGSPHNISVIGLGVNTGTISISPPSLAFGDQGVGSTSSPQLVTVKNSGTDDAIMIQIAIAGKNKGDFAETNDCPHTLRPRKECQVSVTFTPTATGDRNASLRFKDTAAGSPQSVSLTGTGVAGAKSPLASARPK
jgi:hypothetical protein